MAPSSPDPVVRTVDLMVTTTLSQASTQTPPQPARTISRSVRPPVARAVAATKVYGSGETRVTALDAVTVDIPSGELTAIMGPSGSGKSTLMHCLAGLDSLTSGQVFLDDVELSGLSDRKLTRIRRDRIGFVFQAFNLLPTLTALENLTLPMDLAGRKPDQAWLDEVVGVVGLTDRLGHRPSELSGGQQQRVAVARALAGRPAVIFTILNQRVSAPRLGYAFSVHGLTGNLGWALAPVFLMGFGSAFGHWRHGYLAAAVLYVLSFPVGLPPGVDVPLLGDIVVCAPVVNREAAEQHKAARAHWAHMLVYGTLHLLGHDHERARDAAVMEALEVRILAGLKFPDPYQEHEQAERP